MFLKPDMNLFNIQVCKDNVDVIVMKVICGFGVVCAHH